MFPAYLKKVAKLARSLRDRGVWRTLSLALFKLWYDRKLGIDTGHYVPIEQLDIDEEARGHARPYVPSSYAVLREAFNGRFVDVRGRVLVDYGCGAGRVLMFAAMLPFKKVIGVELSPSLSAEATSNLTRFFAARPSLKPEWEVVTCDARRFDPPDAAAVFYFYKPVDAAAFRDVMERIETSLRRCPRACTLIYASLPETPLYGAELGYAEVLTARGWKRHPLMPKEHFAVFTRIT
jgi:SAM-dependent methyltransferase